MLRSAYAAAGFGRQHCLCDAFGPTQHNTVAAPSWRRHAYCAFPLHAKCIHRTKLWRGWALVHRREAFSFCARRGFADIDSMSDGARSHCASGKSLDARRSPRRPCSASRTSWETAIPYPNEPAPPAAKPPSKSSQAPAAPCQKDFLGDSAADGRPAAVPDDAAASASGAAATQRLQGPRRALREGLLGQLQQPGPASSIICTTCPSTIIAIHGLQQPTQREQQPEQPSRPVQKISGATADDPDRAFLAVPVPPTAPRRGGTVATQGNCTPVAESNRHPYRWRYLCRMRNTGQ